MEEIHVVGGENYPDLSGLPGIDDVWNTNLTKITQLEHVKIALCVSTKINITKGNLVVFIFPDTTLDDVKKDWKEIKQYRNSLSDAQGQLPVLELGFKQTIYLLHHDFHMSYGSIAKFLNFELLVIIAIQLGLAKEKIELPESVCNFVTTQALLAIGLSKKVIDSLRNKIINSLKMGIVPWDLDSGPFEPSQIREIIRSFSQRVEKKEVVFDRKVEYFFYYLYPLNARAEIIRLLYKTHRESQKKNQRLINKWESLRIEMLKDFLLKMQDLYPTPATMGGLDRLFP